MLAVEETRAVALELSGDATPVVHELKVAEEHAMHEQDGVSRGAHALLATALVETLPLVLEACLRVERRDDLQEEVQVHEGHHPKYATKDAQAQAELDASCIGSDHAAPEHERLGRKGDAEARRPGDGLPKRTRHTAGRRPAQGETARHDEERGGDEKDDEQLAGIAAGPDAGLSRPLPIGGGAYADGQHPASQDGEGRCGRDRRYADAGYQRAHDECVDNAEYPSEGPVHAPIIRPFAFSG